VTVVSPGAGDRTSNTVFFPIALSTVIAMSRTDYGVGSGPPAVSTGDLNGGGKLDLVLTNAYDNTISILLGNGDGTFQTQVTYAVGENPRDIAIADFNGDGKLDLAVTNTNSNTVSILLGNGDGTFQPQVQYGTGTGAYGIAAADVNGDGKLDLVVTNSGAATVSVLLGNGDGTFQAAVNYAVGTDPRSVAVGDFNRDGKLDLAVTNFDGHVSVLLGNGDGTFSAPTSYSAGSARFVTAAEFNGDGKLDLAVANQFESTISIFLGNGDGTFQPQVIYATGYNPTWVGAADFNGDGKLDLATPDTDGGPGTTVSILLGNGDGTFQSYTDFTVGDNPDQIAIGDFNGDGRLDMAVANGSSNTVSVLLQVGGINLSPASVNFGVQVLGSNSPTENVTLTNAGTSTLSINSIAITGTDAGDFNETNTCGSSLAVGATCTVSVIFKPTATGPRAATVTITDSATGSPQSVTLNGTGVVSGPNATLSPTKLTFAAQLLGTPSPARSVTLINWGTMALDITSIVANGDFSASSTCGSSLAAEASCTISVTFTPTQLGSRGGTLSLTDSAHGSPQAVKLAGVGTEVELNPSSLSFHFGVGQLQTTLTNVGSSPLNISSIVTRGSSFSQTNTCGSGLAAGGSCTITVSFSPKGRGHYFSGTVVVTDNGGGSPQKVTLSGNNCFIVCPP
jgi:hypothetical protein